MLSWPGRGQKDLWAGLLAEWGIGDEQADTTFARMALKALPRLAKAGIPIMAVCGDADRTVPFAANMQPVADAYAKLGGTVELIVKPGCDHHPHSLDDPTPVVDFILRYQDGYAARQHVTQRTGTARAFQRFRTTGKGCVAFLGGSITAMRGWKEEVEADLRQRFPHTEFTFIEAGLPSAGSTPHAFRLEADVLAHGTPDLLFVEARRQRRHQRLFARRTGAWHGGHRAPRAHGQPRHGRRHAALYLRPVPHGVCRWPAAPTSY